MPALCRDCLSEIAPGARCPACGSPRILSHPELFDLSIAHLDADGLSAAVEKREDPRLADRPVIVGGGRRGVVSAACYVACLRPDASRRRPLENGPRPPIYLSSGCHTGPDREPRARPAGGPAPPSLNGG